MKIVIFPNLKKSHALECTKKTINMLHTLNISVCIDERYKNVLSEYKFIKYGNFIDLVKECDYIIVIGGDGTILECSRISAHLNKPILGINSGRLGFMSTFELDELKYLKDFAKGNFKIVKRMMLEAYIERDGKKSESYNVLNDVVVTKGPLCKITDFEVYLNDTLISSLRADGLIFSTPTGATAYSLSAGGPLIEPDMECIEFTQICPFSLFARSMIFSPDKVLTVKYNSINNKNVVLSFDGNIELQFNPEDKLFIKKSNEYIYFVDINNSNFYHLVNKKLMKPLKEEAEG